MPRSVAKTQLFKLYDTDSCFLYEKTKRGKQRGVGMKVEKIEN